MKREQRVTVLSIGINSIITFIKIYAGMIFNSYTLMVSGYNTLCDTIVDFTGFSGSVFRSRRASRKEPFGYGKYECLCTSFLGLIILLIGIFIILKTFFLEFVSTDIKVLVVLLILILVKYMFSNYLFKNAKSVQSEMLMDMAHVSYYDVVLNVLVVFFTFLANIIPVFDLIGSLFLGTIIIYKGFNIILNNYISLKCQNVRSKKVIKKLETIIKDGEGINYSNCTLVNVKKYYKAIIEIEIDDSVSLHNLILWEEYLKDNIKSSNIDVKYVTFLVYKNENVKLL